MYAPLSRDAAFCCAPVGSQVAWRMTLALPAALRNSHRNGGSVFLIFVADPITVRLCRNLSTPSRPRPWQHSNPKDYCLPVYPSDAPADIHPQGAAPPLPITAPYVSFDDLFLGAIMLAKVLNRRVYDAFQ